MSAGGALLPVLRSCQRSKGTTYLLFAICFQLLLCPMIDNLHDTESGQLNDHAVWNRAGSLAAWDMYLNMEDESVSPYAAAQRARDLANLPSAFISVGEVDLFLDENLIYANRLKQSGNVCEIRTYSSVFHDGEIAGSHTQISKRMIGDYVTALKNAFNSK